MWQAVAIMSDQPATPHSSLAAYVRDNPLSRYAPYRRTGRHITALVLAWISFGASILALLLLVLALLAGGGYALLLPMLFVWTFWIWSLVGVIALLLTIGLPLCNGVRTLASFGIALPVLSFVTVFLLYG